MIFGLITLSVFYRSRSFSILLIAVVAGSGAMALRQAALNNDLLLSKLNADVSIEGIIKSDPILKKGRVVGSRKLHDDYSCLLKLTKIDGQIIDLPIRLYFNKKEKLLIDQQIHTQVKIIKSKERKVAALAISRGEINILGQPREIFMVTSNIREKFRSLAMPSDAGALIPGLVIGDTSLQSFEFAAQMRKVGLSHLTAVSGANFALVAAFLLWFLQFIVSNVKLRVQVTFITLVLFIFLVRPTPSVLRAAVMTAVILIARSRAERSYGLSALGAAITLLIALDPFQAIDPGFALSVLATSGILIFSPTLEAHLSKFIKTKWLTEVISIPISATIFCTPVVVMLSGQLSLITIPANILVSPVIAPITVIGFISAIFALVSTPIAQILLWIATLLSNWIVLVSKSMSSLPVITFSQIRFFLVVFTLIAIAAVFRRWRLMILISSLLVVQLFYNTVTWPGSGWQVVNCDVGQGDGLVVNLGEGAGLVIDTGPDPVRIDGCLNNLGIRVIPLLVLTHFHADHIGGLTSVINNRKIGQVWISNLHQPEDAYKSVMQQLSGLDVRSVVQGQQFTIASTGTTVKVLWPQPLTQEFTSLPGDGSAINNSSIALIIKTSKISLFTGGDIEPPVQELISKSADLTEVDILKVSHHGSAYQYLPMLDILKPKSAIISVGAGNTYGHPDSDLIAELIRRGVKVWRTDNSGGISVATPNKIRVTGKEWWKFRWA